MEKTVEIVGAGLAGSEAALQLADRGIRVRLYEMRPGKSTPVHTGGDCAELVCSNSLKSTKHDSAAGMLKSELAALDSRLLAMAYGHRVPAGGALAVDREAFSRAVTEAVCAHPLIDLVRCEATDIPHAGDATLLASGPLTSDGLARSLEGLTGAGNMAFYDAAAPIVMADSLDREKLFTQSRYEEEGSGDYLNAPFSKEEYDAFIEELVQAKRVIQKDFETSELFQACQPIEEIARKGKDAPRFGTLKPVGLTDPKTGRRPWAALQLRVEDAHGCSYNLVGFQTNLTFPEQARVFRMIPGLGHAEFARYGVMHRNTFIDAPRLLCKDLRYRGPHADDLEAPLFVAGQLAGTEGYCEAIMSGLIAALAIYCTINGAALPPVPQETAFGALLAYASDENTKGYQPMHVNFGLFLPLETPIRNKRDRYAAYARRGEAAMAGFVSALRALGVQGGRHDGT